MTTRPATALDEQVAAALLPVLLHRINNTTQTLVAVRALLDGGDLPPRGAIELAHASSSAHEEGWLLGVIASGLGADLLLARHESDGLAPLVRLLREAVRRAGRDLEYAVAEVPRLLPPRTDGAPESWRVSWAVATCLWTSAVNLPEKGVLNASFKHANGVSTLRGGGGADDAWLALATSVCASLAHGAACARDGATWTFKFPRESTEPAH